MMSCRGGQHPRKDDKAETWQVEIGQLNALLKTGKEKEAIDSAKRKSDAFLKDNVALDNMQVEYANQLVKVLLHGYVSTRQFRAGVEYLDSLASAPFMRENCYHELWAGRAYLYQLSGNNEEAVRLADEYLQFPVCTNPVQFISNAEAISGVYVYCSNDIPKAVRILEKAVEVYRNNGEYPNMVRVISRLGIYYRLVGEYEKATAINQEAIACYNDSLSENIVIAYGEQANLYAELGLYEQALQYNTMAIHYSLQEDSFGLGDVYRFRADIFMATGDKDSVFHYLRLAGQTSAVLRSSRGVLVNKVAFLKAYLDYPDSLQRAVELGYALCPDTARIPKWAKYELELYLGQALLRSGQSAKAIPMIERASQGFAAMDMIEMEFAANKILLEHYKQKNKIDAFMHYYNRNQVFEDSLKIDEKLRATAAANIRFEAKRKEKENELLSARIKLQQRQLFYNIYISVTLLLILGYSVVYIVRKRRINRLLIEHSRYEIQCLLSKQQKLNRHNEQLAEQIEQLTANNNLTSIRQLVCQSLLSKEDEIAFRQSFAMIHPFFLPKIRKHYPQLTRNEELLAMLICMGQSTDEIALVMGINRSSVNVIRSRMRRNMGLLKEDSLDETIKQFL